uniref:Ankyrin repeat protein n=1 Tax=Panagrolaimus sp. PS1159 TaxID=55785 RepID=A0AC35F9F3_9BILA
MERFYDTIVKNFLDAAATGNIEHVKEAIKEYKVNIMAINGDHDNALILAALNGHYDMIEYLLSKIPIEDQKECIESGNQLGITPIIAACASGNYQILRRLLKVYENGIQNVIEMPVTDMGNTCLGIACAYGHLTIVKFLVLNGFGLDPVPNSLCPHPLMLAMINGHSDILDYFYLPSLYQIPAKLNLFSHEDQEEIRQSLPPNYEIIPFVDIDQTCPTFHNLNILALAVVLNKREMYEYLIGRGANLNAIIRDQITVRSIAASFNFDISTSNDSFYSSSGTQSINSLNAQTTTEKKKSRKSIVSKFGKLFKNNNHQN